MNVEKTPAEYNITITLDPVEAKALYQEIYDLQLIEMPPTITALVSQFAKHGFRRLR